MAFAMFAAAPTSVFAIWLSAPVSPNCRVAACLLKMSELSWT